MELLFYSFALTSFHLFMSSASFTVTHTACCTANLEPPTLTLPPNRTLACTASQNVSSTGNATASTDCGVATVTFRDIRVPGACAFNFTILRAWTATDECGNESQGNQTLTVVSVAPTLTVPNVRVTTSLTWNLSANNISFPVRAERNRALRLSLSTLTDWWTRQRHERCTFSPRRILSCILAVAAWTVADEMSVRNRNVFYGTVRG